MNRPNRQSLWGQLSVGAKLALIPIMFILVLAGLLAFTVVALANQRQDGGGVDLAGRQRMLLQRHLNEVLFALQGMPADYPATRQELFRSAEVLLQGGSVSRDGRSYQLPPAPTSALRDLLEDQQEQLDDLFRQADRMLQLSPEDPSRVEAMDQLRAETARVTDPADRAVRLLVEHSNAKTHAAVKQAVALAVLISLLGLALNWVVARSLLTPLAACVSLAKAVGDGDLTVPPAVVTSGDEIGRLTATFNRMLERLHAIFKQILQAASDLSQAALEITGTAQEQAVCTTEQATSAQQTSTTMEEIGRTGKQMAERAQRVAEEAEAAAAAAKAGTESVRETRRSMEEIGEKVDAAAQNVVALSQKTRAVGEVITTVKELAERANLLALNAAIEAAAVGEQGLSFAVVADEMKSLADQSREATVRVRSILEEVQQGISSSALLTEEVVKRVESGREHVQTAERTIRRLTDQIEESLQAFQQIVAGTQQQQIGVEQVDLALQEIVVASEESAKATRDLEGASRSLSRMSEQFHRTMEEYQV